MVKITPLFSGSTGNSTLIQTSKVNILLDAGRSCKAIVERLAKNGLTLQDISAIVVTHEHSDHISALKNILKRCDIPIYAPSAIVDYIEGTCLCDNVIGVENSFDLFDMHVDTYKCSHDAIECFGYRFTNDNSIGCVTDTGTADQKLIDFLAPCQTIFLESNHDVKMLTVGPYPYPLKRRIASELGHLSNNQAAEVLKKLINTNVKNVVLAHLSRTNNSKDVALQTALDMYNKCGVAVGKDVFLYVADWQENEVTL